MCAQTDELRWRPRPLAYYLVSHFVGRYVYTPTVMRGLGFDHRAEAELSYWYRPAAGAGAGARPATGGAGAEALVFVHGVGFGPAPYGPFLDSVADAGTPVLAIELEAASQRLFPRPPPDSATPACGRR